jgi:ornithine decarboxylase
MNKSQLRRHFSDVEWARIRALADTQQTPFLVVHLDTVRAKYQELREGLPRLPIYYAVKANPAPEVLNLLAGLGCNFDIASRYELDLVMGLGVTPRPHQLWQHHQEGGGHPLCLREGRAGVRQ